MSVTSRRDAIKTLALGTGTVLLSPKPQGREVVKEGIMSLELKTGVVNRVFDAGQNIYLISVRSLKAIKN